MSCRKSSGNRMSSKICKSLPSFCTAYIVSKDGLSSVYSSGSESDLPSGSGVPKGNDSSSSSEVFSDGTSSISGKASAVVKLTPHFVHHWCAAYSLPFLIPAENVKTAASLHEDIRLLLLF